MLLTSLAVLGVVLRGTLARPRPEVDVGDLKAQSLPESTAVLEPVRVNEVQRFERTLRATYYYHCPVAGRKVRAFEWQAVWTRDEHGRGRISVRGVNNIDTVGHVNTGPLGFNTDWLGHHCIDVPGRLCSYAYSGRTEGSVDQNGIAMSLDLYSMHAEDLPQVTEWCTSTAGLPPGTCPATQGQPGPVHCRIVDVDVAVVQPHP